MKLFLLCITSIFFLLTFQGVEKQSENVPVQSENDGGSDRKQARYSPVEAGHDLPSFKKCIFAGDR